MYKKITTVGCALMACTSLTAQATLPEPVKAMIEAAIASKNDEEVQTIVKFAKSTNKDDIAEIDTLLAPYEAEKLAAAKQAEDEKYAGGIFANWTGQGELGAFRSTGNTSNTGVSGGLALTKEGRKWRHNLKALADFQRTNGVTTKEQFLAAYEPNYKINDRLYAYGLGQYERDRFQGFSARYSASAGLGYSVIKNEKITLDVKAGPAWRQTQFVGGGSDSALAGLGALDFGWQISPNLRFSESAAAYVQSGNSTFTSTTALDAKLVGALSARFSYSVDHETNPPAGLLNTDTISRVTLVYDF